MRKRYRYAIYYSIIILSLITIGIKQNRIFDWYWFLAGMVFVMMGWDFQDYTNKKRIRRGIRK